MPWLLFLFVVVPAIELALLIRVGARIGAANTFLLVVLTGIFGSVLAKRQGLGVYQEAKAQLAAGQVPGGPMIEGLLIFLAGVLLMTPGIMTDIVGFLCLAAPIRSLIKSAIWKRLKDRIHLEPTASPPRQPHADSDADGPIIDVTPGPPPS